MATNEELLDLVKELSGQVKDLRRQIRSISIKESADVPEDVLVAIAAGVAAYLGYGGSKRQLRFSPVTSWNRATKVSQINHMPIITR